MADTDKPGSALEAVEQVSQAEIESLAEESAPEQDDSSPSTTEQPQLKSEESDDSPEAAIEPSDDGAASEEESTDSKIAGYIPTNRHQAVLTKARNEAQRQVDEVKKSYDEQLARLAWAEKLNQEEVLRAVTTRQEMLADPLAFHQRLLREIEADPHLGPKAKLPAEWKMPEPDLVADDGRKVYSVELQQQIREHDQAVFRAEMAEMQQQLLGRLERQEQIEQQRQLVQQTYQQSQEIMAVNRENPIFRENEAAIAKRFAEIPDDEIRQLGVPGAVQKAFAVFLSKDYTPKLKESSKQQTLNTLQKKAAAGSVDPASGTATAASRPRNAKQLEKRLAEIAGAA